MTTIEIDAVTGPASAVVAVTGLVIVTKWVVPVAVAAMSRSRKTPAEVLDRVQLVQYRLIAVMLLSVAAMISSTVMVSVLPDNVVMARLLWMSWVPGFAAGAVAGLALLYVQGLPLALSSTPPAASTPVCVTCGVGPV